MLVVLSSAFGNVSGGRERRSRINLRLLPNAIVNSSNTASGSACTILLFRSAGTFDPMPVDFGTGANAVVD